jgi:hypothetical protein
VKKVFRPEGRQDGSGGRSLRGDAHDFFPQVDPQNAMRGQLLYAGPSAAPGDVVLLVIERRSAAEVRTWAQLVQKELDHLAQLTNRTIDPIAERKIFRMRKLNP